MTREPPHARAPGAVALELGSDPVLGLTIAAAGERLVSVGPNRLPSPSRPAYAAIAARQLADPLVALLIGAAVVSAAIGEGLEAAAIAAIVVATPCWGSSRSWARSGRFLRCGAPFGGRQRSCATAASGRCRSRRSSPAI